MQSFALPPQCVEHEPFFIPKLTAQSVLLAERRATSPTSKHVPAHVISHRQISLAAMGVHVPEQVSSFKPWNHLQPASTAWTAVAHVSLVWMPASEEDELAQGSSHVTAHEHRSPSSAAGHVEVHVPA